MEVEHVAGVGLAPGRAAEQQRDLPVGGGVLGQVVVDDQRGLALLDHEVLGHRAAAVGGDVLHRGRLAAGGQDDDGVVHRPVGPQRVDDGGDRGLLLPDGDVDAQDAGALLVDDRVDGDGGLAGLAVTDDQLALPAADGRHRVDGLDAGRASGSSTGWRAAMPGAIISTGRVRSVRTGPRPSRGLPSGFDHPPQQPLAHRHGQQPAGRAHDVPGLDLLAGPVDRGADGVLGEVEHLADRPAFELQHLPSHRLGQPEDLRNAVADLQHPPHLRDVQLAVVLRDLLADDAGDFVNFELHGRVGSPLVGSGLRRRPSSDAAAGA